MHNDLIEAQNDWAKVSMQKQTLVNEITRLKAQHERYEALPAVVTDLRKQLAVLSLEHSVCGGDVSELQGRLSRCQVGVITLDSTNHYLPLPLPLQPQSLTFYLFVLHLTRRRWETRRHATR
jgi:hypothetical protein